MARAGPATRRSTTAASAALPRAPAPGALTGHFRSTKAAAARPIPVKPAATHLEKAKAKAVQSTPAVQSATSTTPSTSLTAPRDDDDDDDDDGDAIRSSRRKRSAPAPPIASTSEPAPAKRRRIVKRTDETQHEAPPPKGTPIEAPPPPSTPPPAPSKTSASKRATPTASPRAGLLGAPLRSSHSPAGVGVRTDPDSGKMWLLLPGKGSPKIGAREWAKRMREEGQEEQAREEEGGQQESDDDHDEADAPVREDFSSPLKPGKDQGVRVRLGSPLDKDGRIPPSTWETKDEEQLRMARQAEEEDEQLDVLRPKQIREAPTGRHMPLLPERGPVSFFSGTPSKAPPVPATKTHPPESDDAHVFTSIPLASAPAPKVDFSFAPLRTSLSGASLAGSQGLPPHYATLLTLHSALEHALVVHLATSGSSYTTSTASSSSAVSPGSNGLSSAAATSTSRAERTIGMPNLIRYSELRPLVERSSGRRLGERELRSLVCLWSVDPDQVDLDPATLAGEKEDSMPFALEKSDEDGPVIRRRVSSTEEESETNLKEVKGLGFIVGRTRCIDNRGRKAWDWSLGIEVKVMGGEGAVTATTAFPDPSRLVALTSTNSAASTVGARERCSTPPPATTLSRLAATPGRSPGRLGGSSMTSSGAAREGMSVVAMWNLGMEARKREVRRRLEGWALRAQEGWRVACPSSSFADEKDGKGKGKGKEREKKVEVGIGGLLTPSATRESGAGGRARRFKHFDEALLARPTDFDDEEDVGEDDGAMLKATAPGASLEWDEAFPLKDAPRIPTVELPVLKDPTLFNPSSLPSRNSSSLLAAVKAAARAHGPVEEDGNASAAAAGADATTSSAAASTTTTMTTAPQTPSTSARAQSLEERIRAKEAATRNILTSRLSGRGTRGGSGSGSGSGTPTGSVRPRPGPVAATGVEDSDVFGYPSSARIPPLGSTNNNDSGRSGTSALSTSSGAHQRVSRETIMASFKRRSTLSRLDDVAEAIFMLFTTSAGSSSTISCLPLSSSAPDDRSRTSRTTRGAGSSALSSSSSRRAPLLPYSDVLSTLIKSSKVGISRAEADEAVRMLRSVAPGFLDLRKVGGREWMCLGCDGTGGAGGDADADADADAEGGVGEKGRRGESLWGGMSLRGVRERIREAVRNGGA